MSERDIFIAALPIEDPVERSAYLAQACAGDAALQERVRGLLGAHGRAGEFLDRPAPEQLAAQGCSFESPIQPGSPATGKVSGTPTVASEPTQAESSQDGGDESLDFLTPSERADSLGRVGHYEVLELVGRGGMGIVLRAFDKVLHRVVAIKVMAPQLATSATARRRFLREARAAAAVSHDNVVTIHAVEEGAGLPYLVMQFVAGMSLQEKLDREGPPELKEVLRIGMQAAAGLAAAHAHGIVHRDIKPANILLENGVERVKITDFGLARAIDDASLTQSGVIAGTPQYMSPEQAEGRLADHRSDLFSLGSVLYALCTGRPPFRAETTTAVLRRVCEDNPRSIREVNPDVPHWLCDIVGRLHAKAPTERFQSATELATLLGRHLARLQGVESPHPEGAAEEVSKLPEPRRTEAPPVRYRRRWAAIAALLLLLFGGLSMTEATGVTRIASTAVRIFTPEGTLVVAVDDPSVKVTLDGDDLVIHGAGVQEFRLRPGSHRLRATKDGRPVREELITITRGGQKIVAIHREPGAEKVCQEAVGEIRRFEGHTNWVISVAFSPDNRRALSASHDGTLRLWDVATGEEVRRMAAGGGWVEAVAFSPNGSRALSGHQDGVMRLWEVETGKELNRFSGHKAGVRAVAFSPDGSRVLSGSKDATVRLWDAQSGAQLCCLAGHTDLVESVAFSHDGRHALSGSWDHTVRLWDVGVEPAREIRFFKGNASGVETVAFSPNGDWALSGGGDGAVRLWNVATGDEVRRYNGHAGAINGVTFSPDGCRVLSAGQDRTIRLWDVESGRELQTFRGHRDWVFAVACSSDGRYALSGGGGWDARGKPIRGDDFALRLWPLPAPEGRAYRAPRPFVVLTGGKKAGGNFATLVEAVANADGFDTIEVRGDGPYTCDPVVIRGKVLTLRAGAGFRPVLRLSEEGNKRAAPLLDTNAALVLEGIELQRIGDVNWAGKPPPRTVSCRGAPLHVANCRFLMQTDGAGVAAEECPVCEVRNCEFLDPGRSLGQVIGALPSGGQLTLENCVGAGERGLALWYNRRDVQGCTVRLTHNTLTVQAPVLLLLNQQPNVKSPVPPPLRLEACENVLDGQDALLVVRQWQGFLGGGKPRPPDEVIQFLPRLISWNPQRNLYRPLGAFLTLSSIVEQQARPAPGVQGLAGWNCLWGTLDRESLEGRPRFQRGDLFARSTYSPERLSPADFRLRAGSEGKGAGANGRDLGANVDLVGPGAPYERWRKTAEYRQWLKAVERATGN